MAYELEDMNAVVDQIFGLVTCHELIRSIFEAIIHVIG